MSSVHHTIEIARSPAVLYARLTDVSRIKEWAPVVVDSTCSEPTRRVGTLFVVDADLKPVGGPKLRFSNVIAEMIQDRKIVWRQTRGSMKKLDWVFELASTPQGTRLALTIDYEMPYSLLGRLVDRLKMNRVIDSACKVNLEGLKKSLEATQ